MHSIPTKISESNTNGGYHSYAITVCKVCKKSNCNHEKIVSTLSKIVENTGKVFPNGKVRVHKRMQIFVI